MSANDCSALKWECLQSLRIDTRSIDLIWSTAIFVPSIFLRFIGLSIPRNAIFLMSSPKLIQMLPFRVYIIEVKIRWSLRNILIIKNSLCLVNRKLVLYRLCIFIFLVGNTFQIFNELMMYSIKYFRIYSSIFQDCELTSLLNIDLNKLIDS